MTDAAVDERSALREARELARSGRAADAVARLTIANRAGRSDEIEKALVSLRREAYLQAPPPASGPWPRSFDDPFPSDDAVPEIVGSALDLPTLGGAIGHHGCVLVRELLAEADAARLGADIEAAVSHGAAYLEGREDVGATSWFAAFEWQKQRPMQSTWSMSLPLGQVATSESPRTLFDLLDALQRAGVLELVADYFQEPPLFFALKGAIRRTPPDHGGGWHQDGAVYGVRAKALALWIALSPCGPAVAPGLDIVPGRFDDLVDWEMAPIGLPAIRDHVIESFADEQRIERPAFEAGDGLFFDHLTPHQTGTGPGFTDHRLAVEMWFFAQSMADEKYFPFSLGM